MQTFFAIHLDLSNASITVVYVIILQSFDHLDILHADV